MTYYGEVLLLSKIYFYSCKAGPDNGISPCLRVRSAVHGSVAANLWAGGDQVIIQLSDFTGSQFPHCNGS